MLQKVRRKAYWLLMAVVLLAAGCVNSEWEVTVGADGEVDEWIFRMTTENPFVAELSLASLETDRSAIEALSPYLQVSTQNDGTTFVLEAVADMAGARAAGIDLIAAVSEISTLEDMFLTFDSGIGPNGNVTIEYELEFTAAEETDDDAATSELMTDLPEFRIITHMPGVIVRFSHGEAADSRTHVFTISPEHAGVRNVRVESEGPSLQPASEDPRIRRIDGVIIREVPIVLDGARRDVPTVGVSIRDVVRHELPRRDALSPTVHRVEGSPVVVRFDGLRTAIRQRVDGRAGAMQHVARSQVLPGMRLPFVAGPVYVVRNWLTPGLFVQDFSFRQGILGTELVGEVFNWSRENYHQVVLGISFFDAQGIFVDHYTVVIPNLPAGHSRGFKLPLLGFDREGVYALRWEWKYGI